MAIVTMTLTKDGVPMNSILVDTDNLPPLGDGEALHDPAEVPFVTPSDGPSEQA